MKKFLLKHHQMSLILLLVALFITSCFPSTVLKSGKVTVFAEEALTEDIKFDSQEFATNTNTVSDWSKARGDSSSDYIILDTNQYFEYTVNTKTKAKYNLAVKSGGKRAGVSLSISINGVMVLQDAKFPIINNAYGWQENWAWQELGVITLSPGKNVIRFTNEYGKSTDSVVVPHFRLDKYYTYDPAEGVKTFPVNENTVTGCQEVYPDAVCLRQGGTYFEYEVYTKKAFRANVSIVCGTVRDNARIGVSVNGVTQIDGTAFPSSGKYSIRVERLLGGIDLQSGENILRFFVPTTGPTPGDDAVVANGIMLSEYLDIDDSTLTKQFPTNINTIDETRRKYMNIWPDCITLAKNGTDYFEYDVYVKHDGRYDVSVFCGTAYGAGCMSVAANGDQQISDKVFPNPYSKYSERIEQQLGSLNLKTGKNSIRFVGSNKANDNMVVESFKISKSDRVDVTLSADSPTRLEVEDYTNLNVKEKAEASAGKWVSHSWSPSCAPIYMYIKAEESGYYNLDFTTLKYMSGISKVNIYFDGIKIADNEDNDFVSLDEEYGKPFSPYAVFGKHTKKRVYVEKGTHILMLDIAIAMNDAYKYMIDYIEFNPLEGYEILSFGASTDEGARHPYAVRKGYTGYAKADVIKVGQSQETAQVYLAEYDSNDRLVNVNVNTIDLASMKVGEEKEFLFPMTYTQDGGTIKAFIMKGDTLMPLKDASVYRQCEFFPNADVVMNEDTQYELAENIKDGNGNNYTGYSIHDDKYDIDAIFYDSVVGDQSKVFAYMGIPKGASAEKPVPAVVCIHGGGGSAYVQWVKKWNDRGYAAIAMAMTGKGPIESEKHPYAGTADAWGSHVFDKDIEKVTMIGNVYNVIRAHNVLRNQPCVDETKVGITGISWGGITTTTTIGVDNRFAWAVPVYGTGYLDESETYFSDLFKQDNYAVEWDPANFAARTTVPTLYINSDCDFHFALTSTTKTCGVTKSGKMSIRHNYPHAHDVGWNPEEIYFFADSITRNGVDPFITVSNTVAQSGTLTADLSYPENVTVDSVDTYYLTCDKHPRVSNTSSMGWKHISEYSLTDNGISVTLPSEATYCYATIKDSNGCLISTRYVKMKK